MNKVSNLSNWQFERQAELDTMRRESEVNILRD